MKIGGQQKNPEFFKRKECSLFQIAVKLEFKSAMKIGGQQKTQNFLRGKLRDEATPTYQIFFVSLKV